MIIVPGLVTQEAAERITEMVDVTPAERQLAHTIVVLYKLLEDAQDDAIEQWERIP